MVEAKIDYSQIASPFLEMEARKILKKLTQSGSHLRAQPNGQYGFISPRSRGKPIAQYDIWLVKALKSRGLITRKDENWQISTHGALWLKRFRFKDQPDQFTRQHQDRVKKGKAEINMNENHLFWLRKRRDKKGKHLISEIQMRAGLKLQEDFFNATHRPRMTIDLSKPRSNHHHSYDMMPLHHPALMARQRFEKALKSLGAGLDEIVLEICCHRHGLENAERLLGWSRGSGKIVLGIALNRLAFHYGMKS